MVDSVYVFHYVLCRQEVGYVGTRYNNFGNFLLPVCEKVKSFERMWTSILPV